MQNAGNLFIIPQLQEIFVVGSTSAGRLDHVYAHAQTLYSVMTSLMPQLPVCMVYEDSLAQLLAPGDHTFSIPKAARGDWCALIPVGHPIPSVTTQGLKWNLGLESFYILF